ncbi:MAG: DUF3313 domain-containing protein [Thiotrichales bacterium]
MNTQLRSIGLGCIVALLTACAGTPPLKTTQTSGFLSNYDAMTAVDTASAAHAWRWISPEISQQRYQNLQIKPIEFFPAPTTTDQVSIDALTQLTQSLNGTVQQSATANGVPLANAAGPRTLVLRSALTSVQLTNKSLKLHELLPVALVLSGAELALGKRDKDVTVLLEYEFIDASTGKTVISGVREDRGLRVANNTAQMTMKNAEPVLKDLVKDIDPEFKRLNQLFVSAR